MSFKKTFLSLLCLLLFCLSACNSNSAITQLKKPSALISIAIIEKNQMQKQDNLTPINQNVLVYLSQQSHELLKNLKTQYELPISDHRLVQENPIYKQLPASILSKNETIVPPYKKINIEEPVYFKMLQKSLDVELLLSLTWELDYKSSDINDLIVKATLEWVNQAGEFGKESFQISNTDIQSKQNILPTIVSQIKTKLYQSISTI